MGRDPDTLHRYTILKCTKPLQGTESHEACTYKSTMVGKRERDRES